MQVNGLSVTTPGARRSERPMSLRQVGPVTCIARCLKLNAVLRGINAALRSIFLVLSLEAALTGSAPVCSLCLLKDT